MLTLRSCLSKKARLFNVPSVLNLATCQLHESFNKIGSREVVGYGRNGQAQYFDSVTFPYPAVRFKEITSSLKALKEKEKGNWKSLTKEEKKCLYRISFCQTLAEEEAPTGEWKNIAAGALFFVTLSLWILIATIALTKLSGMKLPDTFSEERQVAQLKRMLDMRLGLIHGLSTFPEYQKYIKESEEE